MKGGRDGGREGGREEGGREGENVLKRPTVERKPAHPMRPACHNSVSYSTVATKT